MALKVGELFAQLKLDKSKFDKGVDGAEGRFSKLSGVLKGAVAGAAASAGAALAGSVMGADRLRDSLNGLQAQTGATDGEMKGMEKSLRNIYANNYGDSFQDIADSMAQVENATGKTGAALETLTTDALKLRDTFGYEVSESARTAQTMIKNFGITGEQAMTLIAQGAQEGLDKHGDMLDTFNEYSVYFNQMGFEAEGMFNILADGAKNGAFNLDKVGDAVKEMGIRVKDGSKASKESFQMLGFNAEEMSAKFAQGGETAQKAFTQVMTKLSKIEDPVKRNTVGVGLMGTQFEDLESKAITSLANVQQKANMNADTLKDIGNIKYDSFGNAIKGIGRQFVNGLFIPLGKKILPKLNDLAKWVQKHMPQIKETIKTAMGGVSTALKAAGKAIDFVKRNADVIVPAVTAMVAVIAGAFIPTLWGMATAAAASAAATAAAFWPITAVVVAVGAVVAGLAIIWRKWGDDIKRITTEVVQNVVTWFTDFWTKTKEIFNMLKIGLIETWNMIKTAVVQTVMTLVNGIMAKFNQAKENLSGIITVLKDFFINTWENIKLAVMSVVGAFLSLLTGDFEGFKLSIKGLLTAVKRQFENIWSTIKNLVIEYARLLVRGAKELFEKFKSGVATIFRGLWKIIKGIWTNIKNGVINLAKGLYEGVKQKMETAKNTIENIWNGAKEFLQNIDLVEIGENIIEGLIRGIGNLAGRVRDKVSSIVDGIKNRIRNALDINSPSGVTQYYGEMTGEGLAKGAEKKRGKVAKAAGRLADSVTKGMKGLSNNTISPVAANFSPKASGAVGSMGEGMNKAIQMVVELDGREIGRQTAPYTAEEIRIRTGIR